jgi:hypothetical protein
MKINKTRVFVLSFTLILLSGSCKKVDFTGNTSIVQTLNVRLDDGRLHFNSMSDLEKLVQVIEAHKDKDPIDLVKEQIGQKNFVSIGESLKIEQEKIDNYYPQMNLPVTNSVGTNSTKIKSFTSLLPHNGSNRVSELSPDKVVNYASDSFTPVDLMDQLLPDQNFASILDERLEVQVDDMIYKVTPYGTFMIEPPMYNEITSILDNKPYIEDADLSNDPFYFNRTTDNIYEILPGVTLLDTYEAASGNIDDVIQVQNFEVPYNPTYQYRPELDSWIYDSLPTIKYGGKTWLGRLFEDILGREEIYTEKFSSNRRVRVNFYKMSWIVYSAVGISVKMQKKNWIGWSQTNASELRMGWDGIEYYIGDIPPPPSAPISAAPQRFTPVDLPKLTKDYVEVNLLGHNFRFDKNKLFQQGIKELHSFLSTVDGLKPKSERNVNYAYKVWSDDTKRSISYIMDRDEIVGYNTGSLSKVINWSVGLKVSWDFTNKPDVGYAPLKFNVSRASVFGMVKYGDAWKGARIVLENK